MLLLPLPEAASEFLQSTAGQAPVMAWHHAIGECMLIYCAVLLLQQQAELARVCTRVLYTPWIVDYDQTAMKGVMRMQADQTQVRAVSMSCR